MAKNAPTVMVSSTYCDLRQIRQDLASFIEKDMGYNALLSEIDSFLIDPDVDTIENCRRRVEHDADILVLVIGGRYGWVDAKSNKSVTNLEYLTARAKGIPVYAFVDKGILPLLPVWEQNPRAKFGDIVPDTNVFEFIRQVRSVDKVWTFEFEHAQTIIQTLRLQFAHLMREGLQTRQLLTISKNSIPADISGKALRLILEKPFAWEHYLFAQVLTDEVAKYTDLREEHRLGLTFSQGEFVTKDGIFDWFNRRTAEMLRLSRVLADLINKHAVIALGPPGMPGDPKALVFTAKKIGESYKQALEWAIKVRHTHTADCLRLAIDKATTFMNDLIEKVAGFGPDILNQLDKAQLVPKGTQAKISIYLTIETTADQGIADLLRECLQNCSDDEWGETD